MSYLKSTIVPFSQTNTRACLVCGLIKTHEQFGTDGCDNCPFLEMIQDDEKIGVCTSPSYEGCVALMDPQKSWVGKWKGWVGKKPGCYALIVNGELPEDIVQELQERDINYIPLNQNN
ncbi:suppressor of ty 4 [Anaeramoeba flamelloides]|uniref:Suppressor of ty n=1 Tax=Anaeramoeba flamelloides TaxID=1746091 RepID=A0AAV7Y9Z1_9EUKA|nr:suppressor of ty [Anaeramoeba flamelloides]KAJ6236932.1 suppressor of ty 4 [Anaeramoeba flamelloides]